MGVWVVCMSWVLWIVQQWTWECRYLLKILISILLDIYSGVGLLHHIVVLFLIFWETSILFPLMDAPFYILINSVQVLHTHISKIFVVFFLDNSHPDRCKVTLHCGFDLHFPDDYSCWAHFHVPFVYFWWPFVCILWRNVYTSTTPNFKLRYLIFLENLGIPDTINCTY